ncbi:MAG TPA: hypothetical protein PKI85_04255 [Chitinophagaceae bacterium]|nr:hypothetical protein [Chitinophagaceae bacterium]HNO00834.1 hypothetical protein [Chitinophagaceae bacterium]HNO54301.1 hypothetical protein [Chitinophagaceae bacterium]
MRKYCLISYCFLALIFFVRCTSVKAPGTYRSKDALYKLSLNSDSTFLFDYKFQFDYKYSYGFFKIVDNKSIMLRSSIRSKKLPIRVKTVNENQTSEDNFLRISFNFPKDESRYYKCQLLINGVVIENKYCDSLSVVKVARPLNSFSLGISADERMPGRFLDTLYTEVFTTAVNRRNNLAVEVLINDSLFNYRVFDDKVIKASNRKLAIFDANKNLLLFRER